MAIKVQEYLREDASSPYKCWFDSLPPQAAAKAPVVARAASSSTGTSAPATRSLQDELSRAAAVCKSGRQAVAAMFQEARMGRSVDTAGCLPLVEEITASVTRNPGALVSLARLKTIDDYSYMHSLAVCVPLEKLWLDSRISTCGRSRTGSDSLLPSSARKPRISAVVTIPLMTTACANRLPG